MKNLPKFLIILLVVFLIVDAILLGIYLSKSKTFKLSKLTLPSFLKKEPKPGSCLVLEEKYCSKGKPIYKDDRLVFIGFKLPKNTPIFSPFAGGVSNTPAFNLEKNGQKKVYPGSSVTSAEKIFALGANRSKRSFSAIYYGVYSSEKFPNESVEKGDAIGYISQEKIEAYGDYNLLVFYSQFSPEKKMYSLDELGLKEFFSL